MATTKKETVETKKVAPKVTTAKVVKESSAVSSQPSEKKTESVGPKTEAKKTKTLNLSVPMYTLAGAVTENLSLPKEIFGVKVNKSLLAQAMRVYSTNEKGHFSNTKTRGEVEGSTRKIFKQKGTGNARHGAIRAPIFVGGGIALGPKSRKTILDLPKKMRRAALVSALSLKALEGEILGVSDLDKVTGKTKQIAKLVEKIARKSVLIVDGAKNEKAGRASHNLGRVHFATADQLNAFEVIRYQRVMLTQAAVDRLLKTISEEPSDARRPKTESIEAARKVTA
jgi:large subunit ribosomal protein L4